MYRMKMKIFIFHISLTEALIKSQNPIAKFGKRIDGRTVGQRCMSYNHLT